MAIAEHQERYYGLDFVPDAEILVTAGATEAIAACLLSLCEVGDEVVMFEPYYDSYAACTAMAGAQRRVVQLRAPDWSFEPEALENAITDRTRLILVNTPHNPTGKGVQPRRAQMIADVVNVTTSSSSPTRSTNTWSTSRPTSHSRRCPVWQSGRSRSRLQQRRSLSRDGKLDGPADTLTSSPRFALRSSSSPT